MEELPTPRAKFPARFIFNVDETGTEWKIMPRRTYLSSKEDRKTARGTKGMTFKDRLSAIACSNADGSAKVDLTIFGKAKDPPCFRGGACPLKYLSQTNAWSDTATFRKWWAEVFLPFVRRFTHEKVLPLMDGCSSHSELVDDLNQVTVKTYPPNCTSVHQPMDMGIIAKLKVIYRRELLDVKVSTMEVAEALRAEVAARKMMAGTKGLAEGHHPHNRDAAELLKKAWDSVTSKDIARCFVKAKTLPVEMEAKLTTSYGKPPASIVTPAVKALEETLNNVSSSVYEAAQRGSPADDLRNLLAALDITPGKPANQDAIQAAQVWATVDDQADVVKAMRNDAAQDIVEHLAGTSLDEGGVSDPEEAGGDESAKPGKLPPPAYAEVSTHFGALERAAEESGNGEAALYLSRAKMAMIAVHASKPSRQSDLREFF